MAVSASSINSWDWDNLRGTSLARVSSPRRPPVAVPGIDVAGIVEAVGADVEDIQTGDEVYADLSGSGFGGMAEYAVAHASHVAHKPPSLSFAEAASLPHAGVLALQSYEKAAVGSGGSLMINGAGGGVGPVAIQLANRDGVAVTAIDRGEKREMLVGMGAVRFLDFKTDKPFSRDNVHNGVIDVISHQSLMAARRVLVAGGNYVVVGGTVPSLIRLGLIGPLFSKMGDKHVGVLVHRVGSKHLDRLTDLVEKRIVRPRVDKVFTLDEIVEAYRYFASGLYQGKVVIAVD